MKPSAKAEALLEQARLESIDRNYASIRRWQWVEFLFFMLALGGFGVFAFASGSPLSGGLMTVLCIGLVISHLYTLSLDKEAFLKRRMRRSRPEEWAIIFAIFAAVYFFRD